MKRLQPVIWMKGTFLNSQYLQSQDKYIEDLLHFQLEMLNYCPWGFLRLGVDQEALAAGNFKLSHASGTMPDGLLFDFPEADLAPPARPLLEYFEKQQETVDVYLAIPAYKDREINVSMAPAARTAGAGTAGAAAGKGSADTRYLSEVVMLRDENTGASERPVQVARKNFRFLLEGENMKGYSVVRVARVRRTETGLLQLEQRFVPPLLDIAASDALMGIARRLVEILAAKSSILAGQRRMRNPSLADFGTADIANFWLLYTINSNFPAMQHLFEVRRGHPQEFYSALLALGGALTTFSVNIHPRDLPKYDHDDLGTCFHLLDEKVRELLETVVPSNYVSLPLKLQQPYIYATALADDKYYKNTLMYLAVSAEMNEGELIGKVPGLVKVCSLNHIEHLVQKALPGVTLTHVPRPPSQIPVKFNTQYFSLTMSGVYWEAVTRARNLAAYIPGDFPGPQAELIILLPE